MWALFLWTIGFGYDINGLGVKLERVSIYFIFKELAGITLSLKCPTVSPST